MKRIRSLAVVMEDGQEYYYKTPTRAVIGLAFRGDCQMLISLPDETADQPPVGVETGFLSGIVIGILDACPSMLPILKRIANDPEAAIAALHLAEPPPRSGDDDGPTTGGGSQCHG